MRCLYWVNIRARYGDKWEPPVWDNIPTWTIDVCMHVMQIVPLDLELCFDLIVIVTMIGHDK